MRGTKMTTNLTELLSDFYKVNFVPRFQSLTLVSNKSSPCDAARRWLKTHKLLWTVSHSSVQVTWGIKYREGRLSRFHLEGGHMKLRPPRTHGFLLAFTPFWGGQCPPQGAVCKYLQKTKRILNLPGSLFPHAGWIHLTSIFIMNVLLGGYTTTLLKVTH